MKINNRDALENHDIYMFDDLSCMKTKSNIAQA